MIHYNTNATTKMQNTPHHFRIVFDELFEKLIDGCGRLVEVVTDLVEKSPSNALLVILVIPLLKVCVALLLLSEVADIELEAITDVLEMSVLLIEEEEELVVVEDEDDA